MIRRGATAALAATAVAGAAAPAAAQPAGGVRGVVRDERTGEPVAGATIAVERAGALAVSGDDGAFELALPPGRHRLRVTAPWLTPEEVVVVVPRGGVAEVAISVEDDPTAAGEVIELADASASLALAARLDGAEARVAPGSGGDALRVVQSLPGVARPPSGSGDVIVWGAAPRDTRITFDGVPVPFLYHPGGLRSFVPSAAVGGIELLPGAFPVDRIGGTGGLVEVTSAEIPTGAGAEVDVGLLDAAIALHGRPRDGVRLGGVARLSHLDGLLGRFVDDEAAALFPVPAYADGLVRASFDRGSREALEVFVLGSGDREARRQIADDPAAERSREAIRSTGRLAARYHRELAGGDHVEAVGWVGRDRAIQRVRAGGIATVLDDRAWVAGARGSYVHLLGGGAALVLGADLQSADHHLRHDGVATVPPREGDVGVFGQVPADEVAADRWRARAIEAAAYARLDWQLGRFAIAPGIRVPAYLLAASERLPLPPGVPPVAHQEQEVVVEPRLGASVALGPLNVRLDIGRYHQPPDPADTSAEFGTPTLGIERAWHAALALAAHPWPRVAVELVGFGRWASDLVVRSPAPLPPIGAALVQDGEGESVGVQLVARLRETAGLSGFVAYAVSRSERTDARGATRPFDHDQPHALTAVASWRLGAWSLGGRARWISGEPRTEVVGAYLDARSGRAQPIFGAPNRDRLPAVLQLDARIDRRATIAGVEVRGFLEVENLTGRGAAEEVVYSADFTRKDYLRGPPILVLAGLTLEVR